MNRLFRHAGPALLTAVVAVAGTGRAAAQQTPGGGAVTGTLVGPRVAVFNTSRDSCELIDIPDAPARAFRDYKGIVHLVSSHYVMRASLGPTLGTVKHNCAVAYRSQHDPNPADFDDATWLDSFFSLDGRWVIALGHMEYHGWEHRGMCSTTNYTPACWYNADTFHFSADGGYHFLSLEEPENFLLGLPFKYEINRGPEGYSVDTNIVKVGKWYYAMTTDWPWPPNCGQGNNPPCLVPFGGSPIRTANVADPTSWRGWNGTEFAVRFIDPYQTSVRNPEQHIYAPVPYMYYVNAINFYPPSKLFIATLFDPFNAAYGPPGLYFSTSPDLIHWSNPTLVVTVAQFLAKEPKGNWSYAYFSLLDPNSSDPNFSTLTENPYLYYVRSDDNHGPYVRVLFRQKIKLTWK